MRLMTALTMVAALAGATILVVLSLHSGNGGQKDHARHTSIGTNGNAELTEPGQGAFAALSEVVRVLEADEDTDWTLVDIAGLRDHLIDMDRLISKTKVVETILPNGISVRATGDVETIATLKRMVPAHASQLAQDDRWKVHASELENGMELRVTSDDPEVIARIQGLRFFGLMASQDHHREHHYMMAQGQNAHQH